MNRSRMYVSIVAILALCLSGMASAGGYGKKDIVDTAVAAGSFTTLAKALEAADLIGALKGPGPFTVFAPTDEAFAKLPAGTLDSLLKPENKGQLEMILKYHVVPGKVLSKEAMKLSSADTLAGPKITLAVQNGSLFANGSKVITADVEASNGVIHVIDAVMLPPSK